MAGAGVYATLESQLGYSGLEKSLEGTSIGMVLSNATNVQIIRTEKRRKVTIKFYEAQFEEIKYQFVVKSFNESQKAQVQERAYQMHEQSGLLAPERWGLVGNHFFMEYVDQPTVAEFRGQLQEFAPHYGDAVEKVNLLLKHGLIYLHHTLCQEHDSNMISGAPVDIQAKMDSALAFHGVQDGIEAQVNDWGPKYDISAQNVFIDYNKLLRGYSLGDFLKQIQTMSYEQMATQMLPLIDASLGVFDFDTIDELHWMYDDIVQIANPVGESSLASVIKSINVAYMLDTGVAKNTEINALRTKLLLYDSPKSPGSAALGLPNYGDFEEGLTRILRWCNHLSRNSGKSIQPDHIVALGIPALGGFLEDHIQELYGRVVSLMQLQDNALTAPGVGNIAHIMFDYVTAWDSRGNVPQSVLHVINTLAQAITSKYYEMKNTPPIDLMKKITRFSLMQSQVQGI